jgi:hypothetical protein
MKGDVVLGVMKKAFPGKAPMDFLAGLTAAAALFANPKGTDIESFSSGVKAGIDAVFSVFGVPQIFSSVALCNEEYFRSVLPVGQSFISLLFGLEGIMFKENTEMVEQKILDARAREVERFRKHLEELNALFEVFKDAANKEVMEKLRTVPETKIVQ